MRLNQNKSFNKTNKNPENLRGEKLEQIIKEYLYRNAEQSLFSEITKNIEIKLVKNTKNIFSKKY